MVEPGSTWFYPATLGLAAVWALGALTSGPLPLASAIEPGSSSARTSRRPMDPVAPVTRTLDTPNTLVVQDSAVSSVDP